MDPKSRDAIINSSLTVEKSFIDQVFGKETVQPQELKRYAEKTVEELAQAPDSKQGARQSLSDLEFSIHTSLGRPEYTRKGGLEKTSQVPASIPNIAKPVQECKNRVNLTEEELEAIFFAGSFSIIWQLSRSRDMEE